MTDHNLDDLIIDTVEPKNHKTKSFLTIIALFIVILIISIVLTRILLDTPTSDQFILEEDDIELIAPELKLQEKSKELEKIETIEEKPKLPEIKIDKPVLIHKVEKTEPVIPAPMPIELPKIEEKLEIPVIKKPIEKKPTIQEPVEEEPVITKPVVTKPIIKEPALPPVEKYYVQVGSFTKDPSARFLSVIKNSGFKYELTKADDQGNKKLHIGPYKTRADVTVAIKQVRDRINKNAFIVKK